MKDFLKKVKKEKLQEIKELQSKYPLSQVKHMLSLRNKFYSFKHALRHSSRISVIAEVKYRSPSKGKITSVKDHSPVDVALEYQGAGADAVSVLTDKKYFSGDFSYLKDIRDFIEIPIMCKEFIVADYQIYLARALGADAILLIAAMLEDNEIKDLYDCAKNLHCDVLFEVHNEMELERVLMLGAEIVGVNSRNLHSLQVDVNMFSYLIPQIPEDKIRVAESGISVEVLPILKQLRVDAVLVGEYFMRQNNIYYYLKRFMEQCYY